MLAIHYLGVIPLHFKVEQLYSFYVAANSIEEAIAIASRPYSGLALFKPSLIRVPETLGVDPEWVGVFCIWDNKISLF